MTPCVQAPAVELSSYFNIKECVNVRPRTRVSADNAIVDARMDVSPSCRRTCVSQNADGLRV